MAQQVLSKSSMLWIELNIWACDMEQAHENETRVMRRDEFEMKMKHWEDEKHLRIEKRLPEREEHLILENYASRKHLICEQFRSSIIICYCNSPFLWYIHSDNSTCGIIQSNLDSSRHPNIKSIILGEYEQLFPNTAHISKWGVVNCLPDNNC